MRHTLRAISTHPILITGTHISHSTSSMCAASIWTFRSNCSVNYNENKNLITNHRYLKIDVNRLWSEIENGNYLKDLFHNTDDQKEMTISKICFYIK
jgi:hypothetical protein